MVREALIPWQTRSRDRERWEGVRDKILSDSPTYFLQLGTTPHGSRTSEYQYTSTHEQLGAISYPHCKRSAVKRQQSLEWGFLIIQGTSHSWDLGFESLPPVFLGCLWFMIQKLPRAFPNTCGCLKKQRSLSVQMCGLGASKITIFKAQKERSECGSWEPLWGKAKRQCPGWHYLYHFIWPWKPFSGRRLCQMPTTQSRDQKEAIES